ncbi:MAG: vitamin K epoxide reductase family protein [Gammaproteobacteria bacterium]|jgi:uncharacterized membrane protein|nr:vitamin K epoxide reductase family protein [Gammaproteobacteria bacterium]MDX2461740.1 vitamin K epoxide reductase family protein [Gammaproteobacteria bacterium]
MAKNRKQRKSHKHGGDKHRNKAAVHAHTSQSRDSTVLNTVIFGLCVVGMALTAYLTTVKWFGATPLYCGLESSCDVVQSSRWSTLFGLPLSFWGFLTYAALATLLWRMRRRRSAWVHAAFVACIGVGVSIYLTAISVLEIQATCIYCLASLGLLIVIFALLCWTKPEQIQGFQWKTWLPATALSAAIAVGVLHLHYSGVFDPAAGPEKPYLAALATHLEKSGAKFYGAYWCPRCQDQKALFEASANRLPYVECSPGGPGSPLTVSCAAKEIGNFPTWIINGRRYVGVREPKALATHSGFRWKEPSP